MKPTRLLYITTGLNLGGAEMLLYQTLKHLDRSRYTPLVISLRDGGHFGRQIENLGVPLYCLGMEPSRPTPIGLLRLLAIAKQARPDLIQGWMYHGNLAGQLVSNGRVPVVWCIHKSVSALSDEKPLTAALIKLGAQLSPLPAAIVYVSLVGQQQHEALGYAGNKGLVISNGIDTELFRPSELARRAVRSELGLRPATPLVGLIARYHPQKDHATFLQGAALLRERMPAVHFVLAGTNIDAQNSELMGLVGRLNLAQHVHLLGERRDTPRLIAACDLATSSSAFGEGLSLALAEAMAAGVPCVVTDVGDSGLLVGDTGHVIGPRDPQALADAWADLLSEPSAAHHHRRQAARTRICDHYSLQQMIGRYTEVYERVMKGEPPPPPGGSGEGLPPPPPGGSGGTTSRASTPANAFAPAVVPHSGAPLPRHAGEGAAIPLHPRVVIIGGPDVDARLELMQRLRERFTLSALGTEPGLRERFAAAGFTYQHYRSQGLHSLAAIGELVGLLRKLRPDIVHTYATRPSVWGRIAARLAGVPIIIGTLPGLGSLYASNSPRVRTLRALYQPLQQLACRISDRTIFQNSDDLRQFTSEGLINEGRTLLIPGSGVATEIFDPARISASERASVRAELGITPDEIMVTMITRLIRSKGVLEYTAAAQLLATQRHIRFVLIGPRDTQSVDRLSDNELETLQRAVIWPGPRRDIAAVLAASDIFVLPSAYREGIPRVLLEAASMGLPIVTTNTPGCREVVLHQENGLLVPVQNQERLADAITTLANDQPLRALYGQRSRQRARTMFDLTVIAQQTSALYSELIVRKGIRD
jgi:glycosyltransferase involved in cell wall biosynthesis